MLEELKKYAEANILDSEIRSSYLYLGQCFRIDAKGLFVIKAVWDIKYNRMGGLWTRVTALRNAESVL